MKLTYQTIKACRRGNAEAQINLTKKRNWYTTDETPPGTTPPEVAPPPGDTVVPANPEPTVTEKQAQKLAEKARKEAAKEAQTMLLEKLGLDNIEAVATRLKKLSELEQAQMSEAEKLQAQLEEAKAKSQEHEAKIAEMVAAQRDASRRAAIENILEKGGANSADEIYILLAAKHAEVISDVFVGENIVPEKSKGEAVLQLAQKEYALYFKSAGAGSPSSAGGVPPTTQVEAEKSAKDHIKKVHNF
jgi:alanyl-tRNA synthetase